MQPKPKLGTPTALADGVAEHGEHVPEPPPLVLGFDTFRHPDVPRPGYELH
jgi:hypothetical protein